MAQLQVQRITTSDATLVRVAGAIDADLGHTNPLANVGGSLVVDMAGVERITSFGVREWITAVAAVSSDYVGFINCRPIVVAQFNSVADFGRKGEIISLFLPYVCEACGDEFDVLLDLREHFEVAEADPQKAKCPKCGELGEFDDLPESYFSFVRAQGRPRVPDAAARIIAGKLDAPAPTFRVDKEVADALTGVWLSGPLDGRARLKRVLDGVEGRAVVELAGLTDIDQEGAERLRALLTSGEFRPYLARVPAAALLKLFGGHEDALKGTLVSIVLEGACQTCQRARRGELFGAEISIRLAGTPGPIPCETCLEALDAELDLSLAYIIGAMRCEDIPPDVEAYLGARPLGYRQDHKQRTDHTLYKGGTGSYEIIKKIGRGGMAEVFLARQKGIQGFEKRVVLKRILPPLVGRGEFVEMFLQEARVAARISHPNVVQIFDLGEDGGQYFIAMEYVKGWDLAILARAARRLQKPVPLGVACRITAEIAAGLHAAHTLRDDAGKPTPVIHRDISPHNVLLSIEGAVKITDFGISKVNDSSVQTQTGLIKGKIPYMAPEQLEASVGPQDHRIDIYQAGVVLADLVLGYSPFHLANDFMSLNAVVRGVLPDFRAIRPDVPALLEAILLKSLARSPANRFQTARELQTELEAAVVAVAGGPVTADKLEEWIKDLAAAAGNRSDISVKPGLTPTGMPIAQIANSDAKTEIVTPGKKPGMT